MKASVLDFLKHVRVGKPQSHINLTVYPVRVEGYEANRAFSYQVLDEAIKKGTVTVTEVGGAGHVPELLVTNNSGSRVFLMDGEELIGAKQNRIVNTSIMIDAHSKVKIPVSCVEHGRWHFEDSNMKSGSVSHPNLRREKAAQVEYSLLINNLFSSDQSAIWDSVSDKLEEMNVSSDTGDMDSVFRAKRSDLDSFLEKIRYVEGTAGVIAAINGELVCADLFDSASTCRKLWPKLISSYALDALGNHVIVDSPPGVLNEDCSRFIPLFETARYGFFESPGIGYDVRIQGDGFRGSALVCEERVIHLAAFRTGTAERDEWTPLARPSRRRDIG